MKNEINGEMSPEGGGVVKHGDVNTSKREFFSPHHQYDNEGEKSCLLSCLNSKVTLHVLCFCLGIATLLPWFSFITSAQYFQNKFCGLAVENTFLNFFSLAYNFSNILSQALQLRFYQILSHLRHLRILASLVLLFIICLTTTVCVVLLGIPPLTLFWISLISVACCGALAASFTGGAMGLLGTFPPSVTQAFVSGQGFAGCAVSFVSTVTISLGKQDDSFCDDEDGEEGDDTDECNTAIDYSALAYFATCCCVLGLAIVCYFVIESLPSTKYYEQRAIQDRANSVGYNVKNSQLTKSLLSDIKSDEDDQDLSRDEDSNNTNVKDASRSRYLRVYNQIKIPAWSVFFTFTITLSLFPVITVLIVSENKCESGVSRFSNDLFVPIMFVIFNTCDFLGRMSAKSVKSYVTPTNMWIPSVLRLAYIPLILLCNVDGTALPVVFESDVFPIVIVASFGLTNGILASLTMMAGPASVAPRHSSLAAIIMLFSLTMGLCCGASLSFVMLYISQGSFS